MHLEIKVNLPQTIEVEMTLFAKVTITQEICEGIADQYPEFWQKNKEKPEEIAKSILFASVGGYCTGSNKHYEDIWDGVGDLKGLIEEMELE